MIETLTLAAALVLAVIALAVFVMVLFGARREHPASRPPVKPPGPLAGLARRVLGLHVRQAPTDDEPAGSHAETAHRAGTGRR